MLRSFIPPTAALILLPALLFLTPSFAGLVYAGTSPDSLGVLFDGYGGTEFNFFVSIVKVVIALAITLALLVAMVWILKRVLSLRPMTGARSGAIEVLEIRYIAPRKAIALVRIGGAGRVLIVGISDQSMNTLGELSPEESSSFASSPDSQSGFGSILERFTGGKNHS